MSKYLELTCYMTKSPSSNTIHVSEQCSFPVLLNMDSVISIQELVDASRGTQIICKDGFECFVRNSYKDIKTMIERGWQ